MVIIVWCFFFIKNVLWCSLWFVCTGLHFVFTSRLFAVIVVGSDDGDGGITIIFLQLLLLLVLSLLQ